MPSDDFLDLTFLQYAVAAAHVDVTVHGCSAGERSLEIGTSETPIHLLFFQVPHFARGFHHRPQRRGLASIIHHHH